MASKQNRRNNDELESTAELPLLRGAKKESQATRDSQGAKGDDVSNGNPEVNASNVNGDAKPAQPSLDEASVEGPQGDQSDNDSDDGSDGYDSALDDTANLSTAFTHQDTTELPLLDDTTELDLSRLSQAEQSEPAQDDAASHDGAQAEEAPDRGETSEVVSAATIEQDERKKRAHHIVRIAVGVAVVAACYAGGGWYFSSHFLPGTTVNGVDASNATNEEVASKLESAAQGFTLSSSGLDFSLNVASDDIAYGVDGTSMAEAARSQESPWAWLPGLFQSHEINVPVQAGYDDDALTQHVDDAVEEYNSSNMNTSRAYVGYDYTNYQYKVMGSVSGTALSARAVHDACAEAIQNNQTEVSITSDMVRDATLEDCLELQRVANIANRDQSATISITVNGEEKWSLSSELKSWVTVYNSQVSVSQSAVRVWATYYLAPQVAYSDDEGSYTLDVGSMVNTLVDHLTQGDTSAIEAPMNKSSR